MPAKPCAPGCPCGYRTGSRPTQIGCGAAVCPNRNPVHEAEREEYRDALAAETEMERAHYETEMR
jgi:hypothetical protein